MPIKFECLPENDYFLTTYSEQVSETELISSYREFLSANDSMGLYKELCDLSSCDMSEITLNVLKELSSLIRNFCERNNIESAKCACFAPKEINHSIMALYDSCSKESAEETRIFTDKSEAIRWLLES